MKNTTLEKYFFNSQTPGQDLLKLMYADILATIPPNGKPVFTEYNLLEKQISNLQELVSNRQELPKEIVGGHIIMKKLKLKSGPQIGKLKKLLREEQLKGNVKNQQQALNFLKKHV